MLRALSVGFVVVTGCGGSTPPKATEPAADTRPVVTLVAVEQGDVACYVTVRDDAGVDEVHPGTFELCGEGGTPPMGSRVRLTWGRATLLAASCEGNPDCPDHEEADVVEAITIAP